ncbi:MAG: NADH:ubiquinone reductase (Na(+)-transporting) subunit C [Bacteroidales bacterium]|nr:NADH:ubiquinone reductase (Na(+)-transporting) subunit C [Bacteroidales bacterium]
MEKSNTYIFIYSVALVVLVATVLSVTAFSLKEKQQANTRNEKMQDILMSININVDAKDAEQHYNSHITETFIVKANGEILPYILKKEGKVVDTIRAFDIDMKSLYDMPLSERTHPVFKAVKNDTTYTIIPLRGRGLWGPLWGYISFYDDANTISGAVFDHQGETPGLGAEINKPRFSNQFKNKQIFNDVKEFTSVQVVKGASANSPHHVDGISGGTITSVGVNDMIDTCLSGYVKYLESIK